MLAGFTLFHTGKGWQLSTKEADREGWSVRFIAESQAKRILAQLNGTEPSIETDTIHRSKPRVLIDT